MGNGIFLALAMSGGGVTPGTLEALMAARQQSYEKLALFIKWLASTLVYGYYWLKKHPEILDKAKKPDYSEAGTQAQVEAFWKQRDQKDFVANLIREGANLLLSWLKPDDFESKLWGSLLQQPSAPATTNQLLQSLLTPAGGPSSLTELLNRLGGSVIPFNQDDPVVSRPGVAPPAPPLDLSAPVGSAANPVVRRRGGNL